MPYIMQIYVDGGCRRTNRPDSIGAAAALFKNVRGNIGKAWTQSLPSYPRPTNQRAELTGIILGLEKALARYHSLKGSPTVDVTIHSDSRYAIGCMRNWIHEWRRNGWVNARGRPVANQDLIEEASELDEALGQIGVLNSLLLPIGSMPLEVNAARRTIIMLSPDLPAQRDADVDSPIPIYASGCVQANWCRDPVCAAVAICKGPGPEGGREKAILYSSNRYPIAPIVELESIALALRLALEVCDEELFDVPDFTIYTDSAHAIDSMRALESWFQNWWRNSNGKSLPYRSQLAEIYDLDLRLRQIANRNYIWVPKSENDEAVQLCTDTMKQHRRGGESLFWNLE